MNDNSGTHLPVVQPDPMLKERRIGPIALTLAALAATVVVLVVLYGLAHGPDQGQVTSTLPGAPSSPAETTGQASAPPAAAQDDGQQRAPAKPPESGDTATGTAGGPSAKPAPQSRETAPAR
jgi:hypothetical protein